MSSYDPRRSRPTPKVAPDEESAPIDVLLGPDPSPSASPGDAPSAVGAPTLDEPERAGPPTGAVPRQPTGPEAVPVRRVERPPSALLQLSPLLLTAVLAAVVAWLVRRARR